MKNLLTLGVLAFFIFITGCHLSKKEEAINDSTGIKFKRCFSEDTDLSEEEMIFLDSLGICVYTKGNDTIDFGICNERVYEIVYIENKNDTLLIVADFFYITKLGNTVLVYKKKGKEYTLLNQHAATLRGFWVQNDRYVEMVTRSTSFTYGDVMLGHKWNGSDFVIDTVYSINCGQLIETDKYEEVKRDLVDNYPF
jgi:hypothetical protein